MIEPTSNTELAQSINRSTIAWMIKTVSLVVYSATYNSPKSNRMVCVLLGVECVIMEVFARTPLSYPELALPKAKLNNTALLTVLVAASSLAFFGGGEKKRAREPVERARRGGRRSGLRSGGSAEHQD